MSKFGVKYSIWSNLPSMQSFTQFSNPPGTTTCQLFINVLVNYNTLKQQWLGFLYLSTIFSGQRSLLSGTECMKIVTAYVEVCCSLPAYMGDLLLGLWIFHWHSAKGMKEQRANSSLTRIIPMAKGYVGGDWTCRTHAGNIRPLDLVFSACLEGC